MKKILGYQENLPIKNNDIVTIPKGTPYKSSNQSKTEGITKKIIKVKAHHILPGAE